MVARPHWRGHHARPDNVAVPPRPLDRPTGERRRRADVMYEHRDVRFAPLVVDMHSNFGSIEREIVVGVFQIVRRALRATAIRRERQPKMKLPPCYALFQFYTTTCKPTFCLRSRRSEAPLALRGRGRDAVQPGVDRDPRANMLHFHSGDPHSPYGTHSAVDTARRVAFPFGKGRGKGARSCKHGIIGAARKKAGVATRPLVLHRLD